jgi:hypothetical protein
MLSNSAKDGVDVIDIKANPIVEIRPEGILTSDGMLHELDVIALAYQLRLCRWWDGEHGFAQYLWRNTQ